MAHFRRIRTHATYANVTATLALFVALGGGSFAVAALSGSEKTVVKKIAKKQANKRITARAPGLTVEHAGSADSATPTGAAAGDLTGNYPNPTIADSAVDGAKVADDSLTGADIDESTLPFGASTDAFRDTLALETALTGGAGVDLITMNVPAGDYLVLANAFVRNGDPALQSIQCALEGNLPPGPAPTVVVEPSAAAELSIVGTHSSGSPAMLQLNCSGDPDTRALPGSSLTAIRVDSLN